MFKVFSIFKKGIVNLIEPKEMVLLNEQAENIVHILMKDYNAKDQNLILKTIVSDLKVKRKEQELQKREELATLIADNEILYQFNV